MLQGQSEKSILCCNCLTFSLCVAFIVSKTLPAYCDYAKDLPPNNRHFPGREPRPQSETEIPLSTASMDAVFPVLPVPPAECPLLQLKAGHLYLHCFEIGLLKEGSRNHCLTTNEMKKTQAVGMAVANKKKVQ